MLRPLMVYEAAQVITAHASDPRVFDALWNSAAGTVTVTFQQGGSQQFQTIPAGTVLPFKIRLMTAAAAGTIVGLRSPVVGSWFNSAAAITPHDTNQNIFDGVWVNAVGGGTLLRLTPQQGSGDVDFTVAAGQFIPVRTRLVKAATTATVVGLKF